MRTSRPGRLVTSPAEQRVPSRAPSRLIVEQTCRSTPGPRPTANEGSGCAELTSEGLADPHEPLATAAPRVSRPLAKLLQRRDHRRLTCTPLERLSRKSRTRSSQQPSVATKHRQT